MPETFPNNVRDGSNDTNPAFRLFGRRLFSDQSSLELLVEFLLVATSNKRLEGQYFNEFLPPKDVLLGPWMDPLRYAPRARLNLKLFAFFGASKLDTRHETHREHLEELDQLLKERISVYDDTKENVLKTLENLFLGFHGIGIQRTWCAQSFVPISPSMLAGETIWNESFARGNIPDSWEDVINQYRRYFSSNKHRFLACGGEVLYLQICNALRQKKEDIRCWLEANSLGDFLTMEEQDPEWLYEQLGQALGNVTREVPTTVSRLAEFIDCIVDQDTAVHTDGEGEKRIWLSCGWCPVQSWPEGYLFAVELLRVCRAKLDLMDKLDLLETLCSLQVMRSLITQGARYAQKDYKSTLWPEFYFAVTAQEETNQALKKVSQGTMHKVTKTIYDALRNPIIRDKTPKGKIDDLYKQADTHYGHKLFLTIGKRIGLIIPKRGTGTRFVLNSRLLRLLVVALSLGRRMAYDDFKLAAKAHFGLAFDEETLGQASKWDSETGIELFGGVVDSWLITMLEEAGALRRLSDSCAMVENMAAPEKEEEI